MQQQFHAQQSVFNQDLFVTSYNAASYQDQNLADSYFQGSYPLTLANKAIPLVGVQPAGTTSPYSPIHTEDYGKLLFPAGSKPDRKGSSQARSMPATQNYMKKE